MADVYNPELKPCPFCGYDAEFTDDYYGNGTGYQNVFCTNCGAGTAFLKPFPDGSNDKLVVEQWNRRVKVD